MCGLVAASFLAAGTGLALFIILARSGMNAATGITTIETWEVERHEARARRHGGKRRAFPFDFGLYENLKVAFGYRSMWIWMWPWAKAKPVGSLVPCFEGDGHVTAGCTWEGNGVQPGAGWPPEDQGDDDDDEGPRQHIESGNPWMVDNVADVEGFRRRQKEDIERKKKGKGVEKRNKVGEKEKEEIGKGWKNSEGEGLADFGVDEDAEDDDVPLGVLMRKRRERAAR